MRARSLSLMIIAALVMSGCATSRPAGTISAASISPPTHSTRDLVRLPLPAGPISVAVYGLRDQTGQYKPSPDSSFSTSVTQGAASLLITALRDSRWFKPVERENLQDLLTERKIIRALEIPQDKAQVQLPTLRPANLIIEGAIIAYESNVRTGGAGVRYLGIGPSDTYRQDQVTVNLRAVDIRTGDIIQSVTTTKTIFSIQVDFGVFKYVSYQHLLEVETGFSQNEPVQQCVREAIENGLIHLIAQGARDGSWNLKNPDDLNKPLLQRYLQAYDEQTTLSPMGPENTDKSGNGEAHGS